ncbi:zinc finger protein 488 [Parasteatoda tepidariorum]|uniref:zinc finger protein 488 n=1 Tax=Parasteatoda tepidariorum TaxID=114398 RepID=UPI001C71D544|nr:PR domain zinc finger protein 8 [Parasteatoda tepidariorum]XP_042905665.1 PR domain zinc finger protein 8 [Parasteatoda tepidariorum]
MSESYISVVTEEPITCGTLLGPLPLTSGSPDSLAVLTWRCVDKLPPSKQALKINIRDQANVRGIIKTPSWLAHILPARNPEEQTLEIVVKGGQLYFRSLRDITEGQELRAWFGQDLADILKLPMIPPNVVEGEKRFECMLCQERFENPFPVVAHLMYRCRRKDHGMVNVQTSLKKKNGGRVKNFNIATLTDMNEGDNASQEKPLSPPSPSSTPIDVVKTTPEQTSDFHTENNKKRRRRLNSLEDLTSSPKKFRLSEECENEYTKTSEAKVTNAAKSQNGIFKPNTTPNQTAYDSLVYSNSDTMPSETNGTSAFKKVDKSNSGIHPSMSSFPGLFPGSLDPRELLFHAGANNFAPFPYPLNPVTTSTSYGGISPSQNAISPSSLANSSLDNSVTSAFSPNMKHSAGNIHQQLKMAEEFKIMRKIPNLTENGYELNGLIPSTISDPRMSSMPTTMHYGPKSRAVDNFGGVKSYPTPLLPFLPPSLAALSFPTQNWCAKCNASFRMTSDLVYHMRSHHKRETDPQKLKREEKLRCHICNETFRERHHLTRHMTSHQ